MAVAHNVKCLYCGNIFNRDKEPCVQVQSRRYAHTACYEEHERNRPQEEKDIEALEKYIMQLFGDSAITQKIRKQIKDYIKLNNYTYSGILKTLIYWYEVKGNTIEKANHGIGIVPYVYDDARNYYLYLYQVDMANKNKNLEEYKPKEKIVEITSPRFKMKQKRLFNMED